MERGERFKDDEVKDTLSRARTADERSPVYTSQNITIQDYAGDEPSELRKPPLLRNVSSPAYSSPLRHHVRSPSARHKVKESLDARSSYVTSQDDGAAEHRINQYTIKQEIGRGSFGAVHLATDQFGQEFAVKEFSKARLRKRAQSHVLRQPLTQRRRGALQGFNSPLHRAGADTRQKDKEVDSINLIKEEIAIMKKLDHPNLVSLIEVLDDPSEDSLYMVMEMCKKGVIMTVDLEHQADPYPDRLCRYWFRDLILGIEYLHAQGVVHRDIKPDNCLITDDDVLKVVDFGVSEMFEKDSEMKTAKSAGSPAFLPPELCVAKHGDVSGKAADIWSMGVTLYCLKYGEIPFRQEGILELYESIQNDKPNLTNESDKSFLDLMLRILEKNPSKRITMRELREHPWVTEDGADPLLSEAENTANPIEPPTEAEMEAAITGNMRNLMTVVKAVNKFKTLVANKRPPQMSSILDETSEPRFSHPPNSLLSPPAPDTRARSLDTQDRQPVEGVLVAEGIHRDVSHKTEPLTSPTSAGVLGVSASRVHGPPLITSGPRESEEVLQHLVNTDGATIDEPQRLPPFRSTLGRANTMDETGHRGHAHDPLEDQLYLYIGPSTFSGISTSQSGGDGFTPGEEDVPIVSESPGAADMDIYETAYRDEIERILAQAEEQDREPHVYLTRRVDAKLMAISGLAGRWMAVGEEAKRNIKDHTQFSTRKARVTEVSRALREAAREEYEKHKQERKAAFDRMRAERSEANTNPEIVESPTGFSPTPSDETGSSSRAEWKGKAADRGRVAKESFRGLMEMMKQKRNKDKDDVT